MAVAEMTDRHAGRQPDESGYGEAQPDLADRQAELADEKPTPAASSGPSPVVLPAWRGP
jgi:hypothetical protein